MRGYYIKNIGQNRGSPRIWLQGEEVARANMGPGTAYEVNVKGGAIVLRADPNGARVVSSKNRNDKLLPVIDINSKELLALFDGMSAVRLVQRDGEIHILPQASEIRKKERLSRLRNKLLSGEPITVGSVSHGAGVMTHAIHEGIKAGGLPAKLTFANEIRGELLEHARHNNDAWTDSTIPLAAPMQELAFDSAAMRHLPRTDVMELSIPCSGASRAGRSKRGLSNAEDHPEVGHLIVASLVLIARANPSAIVFENTDTYASTASASILRHQLRDLGYETHEALLKGEDFNVLENRKRWVLVAMTEGLHFDWDMLQYPPKKDLVLSDVFDPIADDDPAWSEMKGLKAKEKRDLEAGKGFKMQLYSGEEGHIATINKLYAKVQSTGPKIRHPTNPDLLRQVNKNEHARIKGVPEELIAGMSNTIAHEVLGQGVLPKPFFETGKLMAQSFVNFIGEGEKPPRTVHQLADSLAVDFAETASLSVAEVRRPLPNVRYEGPVTVSDAGMVVQDIGNGIGILHKASAIGDQGAKLGEVLRVQYRPGNQPPDVQYLSRPQEHYALLAIDRTDTAAFADVGASKETANIIAGVAQSIGSNTQPKILHDTNGNAVGSFSFTDQPSARAALGGQVLIQLNASALGMV